MDKDSVKINGQDVFLSTHTTKHKIDHSSSGGSGGSSYHGGSSGMSHGGGSHGF